MQLSHIFTATKTCPSNQFMLAVSSKSVFRKKVPFSKSEVIAL